MEFINCALIGYELKHGEMKPVTGMTLEYETEFVGKVLITLTAYDALLKGEYERYLIAGICKNRTIQSEPPILIDTNFINNDYKNYNPPIEFDEKCDRFLKYIYEFGGKENKEFEFNSTKDFPIAYCDSEEFVRIVDQLKSERFITIRTEHKMGRFGAAKIFMGVKMTSFGKEQVKKSLPKIPLIGLVNQEISTGDNTIDEKINHAKKLFFDSPQTIDKMRSACETLSYVLEPLRETLKDAFSLKDVSDFFQLVNTFDIRHNKETTKKLIYEEQLEWVFYSLLNTINTYTKLKNSGKI